MARNFALLSRSERRRSSQHRFPQQKRIVHSFPVFAKLVISVFSFRGLTAIAGGWASRTFVICRKTANSFGAGFVPMLAKARRAEGPGVHPAQGNALAKRVVSRCFSVGPTGQPFAGGTVGPLGPHTVTTVLRSPWRCPRCYTQVGDPIGLAVCRFGVGCVKRTTRLVAGALHAPTPVKVTTPLEFTL